MKNKDLIKSLLDIPLDATIHVGGFDGTTGECNWDGEVETVRYDRFSTTARIEFNQLFLGVYEDQENETTLHGGVMVPAFRLVEGDTIDSAPIYEYFEKNHMDFNESDKQDAEDDFQVVQSVTDIGNGWSSIIVARSVFYNVPRDFMIEVTNV